MSLARPTGANVARAARAHPPTPPPGILASPSSPATRRVDAPDVDLLRTLIAWRRAGRAVQLVTVASTWGSSPRPPGSMAIVRDDGAVAGSVSGGCVERQLVEARTSGAVDVDTLVVGDDAARAVGLTCGGRLELVFEAIEDPEPFEEVLDALDARRRVVRETDVDARASRLVDAGAGDGFAWDGRTLRRPFGPAWRVLLVGGGELSKHVARFALALDFEVIACEPRAPFRAAFDVAGATLLDELPDDAVAAHASDARSAVLALTHEPTLDDLALEAALGAPCFHVGALGSRRSHARRVERLAALGVGPDALARISAPVGLDIGSRTAAEIGVSIAAELVRARARVRDGRAAPAADGFPGDV